MGVVGDERLEVVHTPGRGRAAVGRGASAGDDAPSQNLFEALGVTETIAGAEVPTETLLNILTIMVYIGVGMFLGNLHQ